MNGKATTKSKKPKPGPSWKREPPTAKNEDYNSVSVCADGSRVVGGTFFYNAGAAPVSKTVGMFAWDGDGNPLWQDLISVTAPVAGPGSSGQAGIYSVAVSRDGNWAVNGGRITSSLGFIFAYDANTGSKTFIHYPSAMVKSVAISGDGSYLVGGGDVLYVSARIGGSSAWSLPLTTAPFLSGGVERVAISSTGEWIAAAVDGGCVALVHNLIGTTGALSAPAIWQLASKRYIQSVSMAADGSGFAAGAADGAVYYFSINDYKATGALTPVWSFALPDSTTCRWVAVSDSGANIAAVASAKPKPGQAPGRGNVFLLKNNGASAAQVWADVPQTTDGPNAVAIDAAANRVAVADGTPFQNRGGFYLFNGGDGSLLWRYQTKKMNYPVAVSADNVNGNPSTYAVVGGGNDGYVYDFAQA
jgi:hypothetical protein